MPDESGPRRCKRCRAFLRSSNPKDECSAHSFKGEPDSRQPSFFGGWQPRLGFLQVQRDYYGGDR